MNLNLKENATKLKLLHIFSVIGVTLSFALFFQLDWTPQWIRDNIHHVPTGQILAYSGYSGISIFILSCRILRKPNPNLARNKSNVFGLFCREFDNFTTMFIDLVSITVITHTFFKVGYNLGGDSILLWATVCSLIVFPFLAFCVHLGLNDKKLEYTIPIFTNRIK